VGGIVDWLVGLPVAVLYVTLVLFGAVENVFPPVPADTVVALASWLAARGTGNVFLAFLAPVLGNIAGAAGMYYVGRTHGKEWIRRKFPSLASEAAAARMQASYDRYGIAALVISRFIPGVRALVPPFAGAMHVPALIAIGAMAVASVVWYGTISYVAFRAGADWTHVLRLIKKFAMIASLVAAGVALVALVAWLVVRRRRAGAIS
jgi:membrane protein DedA with SNARE-associated domain